MLESQVQEKSKVIQDHNTKIQDLNQNLAGKIKELEKTKHEGIAGEISFDENHDLMTGKGKKRARGDVEAEDEERGGGGGGLGLEGALSKKQKRRLVKLQKVQQKKGKA